MVKKIVYAVFLMLIFSSSVFACELHAGGQNFGIFGHINIPEQFKRASDADQMLTVSHDDQKTVEAGVDSSIDMYYNAPLRFQRIKIEFIPSDDIKLLSNDGVNLTRLRGDVSLQFNALSKGQHSIWVNISAIENGNAYFAQQRIMVNAG